MQKPPFMKKKLSSYKLKKKFSEFDKINEVRVDGKRKSYLGQELNDTRTIQNSTRYANQISMKNIFLSKKGEKGGKSSFLFLVACVIPILHSASVGLLASSIGCRAVTKRFETHKQTQ